jgi:hypothetical protein
MTDMV